MHHLDSLLSKFYLQFQNIVSNRVRMQQSLSLFSHFQGRLAYLTPTSIMSTIVLFFSLQCHNARISVLVFKIVSVFLNVSNTVRMQASKALFSFNYMQFQIVSNTIRVHALETLFSFFSRQFQMVLNTVRLHASKTLFSKVSLKFQIVSNTVRIYPSIKAYML